MRLIAAMILLALAAPAAAVEAGRISLTHDGQTRAAILDLAPGTRDAPLLIGLHGGIGGASFVRRRAAVTLAERGWVVAWPEALGDWNDGRRRADGRPYNDADDVGFLRALVAELAAAGAVDPGRVFVAGPSIGGMMTLRVVCEAPDLVAGAAVAIAAFPVGLDCPDDPPIPMLFLHGTADGIVPPEGGRIGGESIFIRDRGRVRGIEETVAHFAARNRCAGFDATPLPDRDPGDGTTTVRRDGRGCAAPLTHYVVEGGGHTWPGSRPFRAAGLIGATSQDFSATAAIEAFFAGLAAD